MTAPNGLRISETPTATLGPGQKVRHADDRYGIACDLVMYGHAVIDKATIKRIPRASFADWVNGSDKR